MPEKVEPRMPRKGRWIVILLIGLAILVAVAAYAMTRMQGRDDGGDGGGRYAATAEQALRDGMVTLRELAATPMASAIGLRSPEEAARAQPGPAFAVYMIRLDELRSYNAGTAPQSLLHELPVTVVPLLVDNEVRSSITISRNERGFVASAFGDTARVRPAAEARARGAGDFIVRVPALGLELLGRRAGGEFMLTPLAADPRLQLEAGRPVSLAAVLQQLVPLARAQAGDAPM